MGTVKITDLELLAFEAAHPNRDGLKRNAIYRLGLTPARYYQRLLRIALTPEAQLADPFTTRRILSALAA